MGYRGIEATEGESTVWGEPEPKELELICCPELDRDGTGELNVPKATCLYRQQDDEFKIRTCYGGCKGRRPIYTQPKTPVSKEARQKAAEARVKEAEVVRERICALYHQGQTVAQISLQVNRGRSLVEKRLLEAGLTQNKFVCGYGSLKQQVFRWLDENPEASTKDVVREFGSNAKTLSAYRTQWKQDRVS